MNTGKVTKSNEELLNEILYDGSKPKLRMYLIKWNVPKRDLEDLESQIIADLFKLIKERKYHFQKVSFEKWISNIIFQYVMSYFQAQKLKKNQHKVSIEGYNEDFEIKDYPKKFGSTEINELSIDIENIFNCLTHQQSFICRCIYYNDWTKYEIMDFLGLSNSEYKNEIKNIRDKMKFYL